ncbi:Detected protein of confused Function [Hibiscus syriacus]|uniref:Detected protein of confused Function n=1 Tax=Hibiscus syriacus TaxID=106335 RepID=A0A6A2ZBR6_HIBSY|nr:Detected protein of confused Function [Hibiscus syriacus]
MDKKLYDAVWKATIFVVEFASRRCTASRHSSPNSIHMAAMKGRLDLLRELVDARRWAARVLTDQGDTILHACVRCNQFVALKFLVERVSDHVFLNSKNNEGNTILHLAIAANQTKAMNLLISSTTIDVNCVIEDGFAALDLSSQNQRDVFDKDIVESLQRMGATSARDKPLRERWKKSAKNKNADWLVRKRDTIMLVASLLAAMAFQAGINPPSGVWQYNGPSGFSLTEIKRIILLLISGLPVALVLYVGFNGHHVDCHYCNDISIWNVS